MILRQHIKHIPGVGERVTLFEVHEDGVRTVSMAPIDAMHALETDPARWSLDNPADRPATDVEADEAESND